MKTLNFEIGTLNLRYAVVSLALIMCNDCTAQIQQAWVARYNNGIPNGTNQAVKMALDPAGNIYVTGFSQNANTNLGYVTIKYTPNGNQLWAARYDDTNYPTATPSGLVLDNSNNAIVTGTAMTVKYSTDGNQLWIAPYAGAALTVDANGNVAMTGFDSIFSTVKISAAGTNLWLESYPASCGAATGQSVVADTNGNFYVTGNYPINCERGPIGYDLLLIKYSSNGNQIWTAMYSSGAGRPWQTEGVAIHVGNLCVMGNYLGEPPQGYVVFDYDINGNFIWGTFVGKNGYSQDYAAALDQSGCIVMTGQIPTAFLPDYSPLFSYGTMKLGTTGATLWTSFYPVTAVATNVANAIAVDQSINSYVTGYSPDANGTNDIVIIKYDQNGNQVWLQRYSSPGNGNAAGNAIAVDNNGNVYVAGYDTTAADGTEMVLIKCIRIGNRA